MIPTSFLYQLAEYEGVVIEWCDFRHIDGLYTYTPTMTAPVIALSSTLQTQESRLRCVLSHELGHHFTTVGHHMIATNRLNSVYATKNELLATKWAVNLLIPNDVFLSHIKKGLSKDELAYRFNVLPEFIETKSEIIKQNERYSDVVSELRANYNICY